MSPIESRLNFNSVALQRNRPTCSFNLPPEIRSSTTELRALDFILDMASKRGITLYGPPDIESLVPEEFKTVPSRISPAGLLIEASLFNKERSQIIEQQQEQIEGRAKIDDDLESVKKNLANIETNLSTNHKLTLKNLQSQINKEKELTYDKFLAEIRILIENILDNGKKNPLPELYELIIRRQDLQTKIKSLTETQKKLSEVNESNIPPNQALLENLRNRNVGNEAEESTFAQIIPRLMEQYPQVVLVVKPPQFSVSDLNGGDLLFVCLKENLNKDQILLANDSLNTLIGLFDKDSFLNRDNFRNLHVLIQSLSAKKGNWNGIEPRLVASENIKLNPQNKSYLDSIEVMEVKTLADLLCIFEEIEEYFNIETLDIKTPGALANLLKNQTSKENSVATTANKICPLYTTEEDGRKTLDVEATANKIALALKLS